MAVFPVVKGVRLRATKINSCGLPQAGPANRLVTDGFVTATLTPVMKDADELEQVNAEGKVCVADRTPPTRKYYTAELELCNVNTALLAMFTGWEQILDYDDKSIGFRDQASVEGDFGVALEIWTGGKSDDDCPAPTVDDIFSTGSSGKKYGYLLFGANEFTLGNIEIGAQVSTFTLSGITIAIPQWGRGPYNVAGIDAVGTPGRLLAPVNADAHFTMFRTPVAPPKVTPGAEAVPLAISSLFVAPDYYFGGPSNAPAADVAPSQDQKKYTVTVMGTPTGGTYLLKIDGVATAPIAYNATNSAIAAALNALPGVDGVTVTGTGPFTVTLPDGGVLTADGSGLTGGTTPNVTVALVP